MPKEEQKNIEGGIQEGKIKSVQDILNMIKRKCVICGKGEEDITLPYLRVIFKEEYKRRDQLQSPSMVTLENAQFFSPSKKFVPVGRRFTPGLPEEFEKQRYVDESALQVIDYGSEGYKIGFVCNHCNSLKHNWEPLETVLPKLSWTMKEIK